MIEKQAPMDWSFVLRWAASCVIGIVVFGLVSFWLRWRLAEAVGQGTLVVVLVAGAAFAGLLALGGVLGPGLLLRRIGVSPVRWIGFSTAAAALTMSIGVSLIDNFTEGISSSAVSALFVGSMLGVPMGLAQWQLLKQRAVPAAIWPFISFAAYVLGIGIVFANPSVPTWLTLAGMGFVVGLITGLAMMWLLRRASDFPTGSGQPAHDSGTPGAVR
ncbi:MAG: hypothetical protein ACK2U5_05995 [Candidatus Promineifilaceae bacterium]|jgi:hypothetical protein